MKIFERLKLVAWPVIISAIVAAILFTAAAASPQTLEQLRYGATFWQLDSAPDTPYSDEGALYVYDNGGTMTLYFNF